MCADAELEGSVDLVTGIMCQYALDIGVIVKSRDEVLSSDLNAWLSLLQTIADEPFRLSIPAAICSSTVMIGILNISKETDFEIDTRSMQIILNGADAVFSYEHFFEPGLQTDMEQSYLIRNVSFLLFSFCDVAADINATTAVIGQPSYESVQSRLRVTQPLCSHPNPLLRKRCRFHMSRHTYALQHWRAVHIVWCFTIQQLMKSAWRNCSPCAPSRSCLDLF